MVSLSCNAAYSCPKIEKEIMSGIVNLFLVLDLFFSNTLSRMLAESLLCNGSGDEPVRIGLASCPVANVTLRKDEDLAVFDDFSAFNDSLLNHMYKIRSILFEQT